MYQCELISVQYKKGSDATLLDATKEVNVILSSAGIERKGMSDVAADPQAIDILTSRLLAEGERDMFIFLNALNSTDHSSFRKLMYRTVTHLESTVKRDNIDTNLIPKLKVISLGDMGNGYKGYCFNYDGKRFIFLPRTSLAGKELPELIRDGIEKAEERFQNNAEDYPKGIALFDKKGDKADTGLNRDVAFDEITVPKKEGFFRSFIPSKMDTGAQKARKIAVLVAIVAFLTALGFVVNFFLDNLQYVNATSEIQEIAASKDPDDPESGGSSQNWKKLKKANKEIVGWITIPDTKIDYPVLYHKGDDRYNQYYINRDWKRNHTDHGSIFLDYRSTDGTDSRNVIMHGHDMLDGSMFAPMLKYSPKGDLKGKLDFYKKHPVITFNTPDGDAKYKIISVFKTSTRYEHGEFFNYMQGEFNSDAEFMNFVYNTRVRSFFNIPVTCNENDQIITLSTCCYEFYQWRMVIVARKVRPGEDESVDVNLATTNSSPLFPDVYYQRYGGTRPEPKTFKTANADGDIDWYDGAGNLSGSEELTATIAANPTEPPTEKPKKGATEPANTTFYQVVYYASDLPDDYSEFAAYNVREGDPVPVPEGKPTKAPDEYYTYEFVKWNTESPKLQSVDFKHINTSFSIEPIFKAIPKQPSQ